MKKRIHQIDLFRKHPVEVQDELLKELCLMAQHTEFGLKYDFSGIKTNSDFKKRVPISTYDNFKPYIDRLREGEQNILWPSKQKWFAKSSGTTSGKSKYIPVTTESLEECHYKGGKDALSLYYYLNPDADVYSGKTLVLGGSSSIHSYNKACYTGDLSAIIIRNLPIWVELKRIPNRQIALMEDWEHKIDKMALASMNEDVRMIVGVPSWTLVLLKRIMEIKGKDKITDVWPNLELFLHGGVSFKPYRSQFDAIIDSPKMNYLETYNASEGFFGIQDRLDADDMLLMLDYGIFYEFILVANIHENEPETLRLDQVELGKVYALVITTNGGLWRYMIGDTIQFTSLKPFRIRVSGRTKHFINAFGEEVIIENAVAALEQACASSNATIADFTAGPVYMENNGKGCHEWFIEFQNGPDDFNLFKEVLDSALQRENSDYQAKRSYNLALTSPLVRAVPSGTFYKWMKKRGKLGGQNKVPRLSNDRTYLNELNELIKEGYLAEELYSSSHA
ncbi:MAG: GH3 auxin-responsive promoter family protein [Flavobacteriales bacterium]